MAYTAPAVVIDNGSYTTKAGFASEDLPSLVFNSNYTQIPETKKIIIGDEEMEQNSQYPVQTLLEDGVIYNFDNIVHNWRYVYDNIDNYNSINSKDYPLVMTEQSWNPMKNKIKTCQLVFEELEVPIFSLVKNPISQLYRSGRSTGLVVDIGSSVTSVTPIIDGVIQGKSTFHTKFAGDFLNLHVINYLQTKIQSIDELLPNKFRSNLASDSFKAYYMSTNILQEYKNLTSNYQISNFEIYDHKYLNVSDQHNSYLNNLFNPLANPIPNFNLMTEPPSLDKPSTQGLSSLFYLVLKNLEASLLPTTNEGPSQNRFAKFMEIFKNVISNVLITGGTSLAGDLSHMIINNLKYITQQEFPNYSFHYNVQQIKSSSDSSEIWDKQFSSWLGACNLACMLNDNEDNSSSAKIALDNWFITKADYEELGEDLIVEKFK
ncbi:uncharacterized protein KGF55_000586 [Candida pseudojiufengensis]|uniref:uncharacterized protein n=1 Tax=Candida pseudojiufengensis TaxID=497109 RepID=UPI0022250728|nr:uncharacterized protein KGF55_000586 [Candida pseudojiufengensis]KAI5966277.1 hypothetical protein KGF55_000586 [Candida pseudojiufengensis]